MSLLEVTNLSVHYGNIPAVSGLNVSIDEGEIVCLLGANGAGKSSTLLALSGIIPKASGTVLFNGHDISAAGSDRIVHAGLIHVPEGRHVFPHMSVTENLLLGAYSRDQRKEISHDIENIFDQFPRLRERMHQHAGTLSGGEQQMLVMGRALMAQPKLLLLDEPSLGLAPLIAEQIFAIISDIAASGVTVLLVEQNASAALQRAQRGLVLESGRLVLSGPADELVSDPQLRAAYLGGL